jgi:hypothetical protein
LNTTLPLTNFALAARRRIATSAQGLIMDKVDAAIVALCICLLAAGVATLALTIWL